MASVLPSLSPSSEWAGGSATAATASKWMPELEPEVLLNRQAETTGLKWERKKSKMSSNSNGNRVHIRHSTAAGPGEGLRRTTSDRRQHFQAQPAANNRYSSSDEGDDECATPRASESNHTSYINDTSFSPFSSSSTSNSTSASSSRYFTSSDTSPASPVRKSSGRVSPSAKLSSSSSSYRKQTTDEEFITRLRAGLTSSTASSTPGRTSPSIRRSRTTTPRPSRPNTRRHSRTSTTTYLPFTQVSLPSLSPEAIQQILSVSVYFVVTIAAGVALIGILAGSYALSVGDDLKYRLIEAKLNAREAVDLAKKEAKRIRVTLEKKAKQVGDSWAANSGVETGAASEHGPNYRELAGHVFQQVTPPFIYAFSTQCYQASSSTYSSISSIYNCATRRNRDKPNRPSPRRSSYAPHSTPSSSAAPPRPPLKSLIPSLGIALLLAMLAFVRNTSFWQTQEASYAASQHESRRRDEPNSRRRE